MARQRMVTRTVVGTECEVQVVSISASEITNINATIGGEYEDGDKLLKAVKKTLETDDLKVLKIVTSTKVEKCYGMLESEFIKLAKELDLKTRKALESEESEQGTDESEQATEPVETAPETTNKKGKKGDK